MNKQKPEHENGLHIETGGGDANLGDVVFGGMLDKRSGGTYVTSGDINAANVNFGDQQFRGAVTFTFNGAPAASQDVQSQLKTLYQQLADALAQAPAEQARDVKEVKMAANDALAEAEKEQPEKERLQIRGDKLIAAAKNLATVAPIAVQIAKTLLLIG